MSALAPTFHFDVAVDSEEPMKHLLSARLFTRWVYVILVAVGLNPFASALHATDARVAWPRSATRPAADQQLEARIASIVAKMTLEQKIGQMVQPDIRYATPQDARQYRFGSILNGGGGFPNNNRNSSVADWVSLADQYYDATMDASSGAPAIPVIWGTDAVHGHNNVIGATLFPHNIGLGATRDPELIERIGSITAREVAATGIGWTFAPTLAVVRDDRWGRTYEGYSEDPEIVRSYAGRMVRGLQGAPGAKTFLDTSHILSTAKHFIGDGGTDNGVDRGNTSVNEADLLRIHGQGYVTALEAGVQTVMASYNMWQGWKLHGQKHLLTDVLKTQMGFDGLIVSDWDGIDEVQGCSKDKCAAAINAGIDLFMVPIEWKAFIASTKELVQRDDVPQSRIDDAVTRILRVKIRAGLFERGKPSTWPLANKRELIGAPEHRAVAREAVRKSLVLLKNKNGVLPLKRKLNVLVAGDGADTVAKQSGGWTLTWQGTETTPTEFPGATSIYGGIQQAVSSAGGSTILSADGSFATRPDVAIVVFGENPYAEWFGDIKSIDYQGEDGTDAALMQRFKSQGIPVIAVFLTGRPLWVNPELNAADAFVVAWLPGSEGGGVADVLFRNSRDGVQHDFAGKLAYSWPRRSNQMPLNRGDASYDPLFAYGFGLTYKDKDTLSDELPVTPMK
jgi:beta-glucosidase